MTSPKPPVLCKDCEHASIHCVIDIQDSGNPYANQDWSTPQQYRKTKPDYTRAMCARVVDLVHGGPGRLCREERQDGPGRCGVAGKFFQAKT
jgi:hypothetical protein